MESHRKKKRKAPENRPPNPKGKVDSQTQSMKNIPSLKLTFSHLKMDGWKTSFLLGWPIFRACLSFGKSTPLKCNMESVHEGPGIGDSDRSWKSS